MKLIVALGNPGREYADTRHNVGWRVAEELARRWGAGPWREKFQAALAEAPGGGAERAVIACPLTYMNASGQAVRALVDFWKIAPADLLVVLDDFALEVGRLRFRGEGAGGGHNGLQSVLDHLGHDQFARLRVGIGPAPSPAEYADFVLAPFAKDEWPRVAEAVGRAADAVEVWTQDGLAEAMNRCNAPRDP